MLKPKRLTRKLISYFNNNDTARRVLAAQEILNQKKFKKKSSLIWTTNKSASVYLRKVINEINKYSEFKAFDYSGAIWSLAGRINLDNPYDIERISSLYRTHGEIYVPLRTPFEFEGRENFKNIFFLRDPRDLLVSRYYSIAFSHKLPYQELNSEEFLKKRNQARSLGIDNFCLKEVEEWIIPHFIKFRSLRESSKESFIFKYEKFIESPELFLTQFLDSIEVTLPDSIQNKLVKLSKIPTIQNSKHYKLKSHYRSGKSRQFESELEESTLEELNKKLKEIIIYLDFYK